ncbi:integrase core domain-containing protein [Hyphomonas pacifica]|uniref:integrase core domain-containing protein n=1 Tax=Hyphomonas pacifica TaxID=1280941 RepID=UPI00387E274C
MLNAEWFTSLHQAQTAINTWLRQYNRVRPHQTLSMRHPRQKLDCKMAHKLGAGHGG